MEDKLKIAICNRKTDKRYKNQEWTWEDIVRRNSNPARTSETMKEYPRLSKSKRDELKDQGGFVGGWLKNGVRKNGNVALRVIGTLDADNIPTGTDFLGLVKKALDGIQHFIYSTHSHTPELQRYRIAVLFSRNVSEEEYPAVMRQIAKGIGMDYFDDTTYQANRMMYWSSCPSDAPFVFQEVDGKPLEPDKYLSMYTDWRDLSQWPTSSRESEVAMRDAASRQADPLAKEGIVGAFCRSYSIQDAIETFLGKVYEPSATEGRYDYVLGEGVAGVATYDGKFAYSHHATDPACCRLLNAFDLVRIHRFGDEDAHKSFSQMAAFAASDDKVKILLLDERRGQAMKDFADGDDWRKGLTCGKGGVLDNTVDNLVLILENDPDFSGFAFNELAGRVQVVGDLPWERPEGNVFWRDVDTCQLKAVIDRRYLPFSTRNHDVAFPKVADDRSFHPIRDYLNNLPEWDGECRVENLFIRYLEADDTEYVRAVTRKTFAGAVARIYRPGTKFDCVPVLDGMQGIGKSTIVKDLIGSEYYSEALSLTDMNDKSAAEKLQGFWIVEIGELAGMKKADIEKVKSFLSTADDKYRPSYGRTVESHPRQCIIIATVNGERGYLRDITGNRRFWIIKTHKGEQGRSWDFSKAERDQFWAEAKDIWESGEKLYLDGELLEQSEKAQQEAMETDDRIGMVETYLDTPLPEEWDGMDLGSRRQYLFNRDYVAKSTGDSVRSCVSNAEIWCECFGRNLADLKASDSYSIAALMMQVKGWERTETIRQLAIYGRQRLYRRTV